MNESQRVMKILVPTDFSPCSDGALDYAVFLARRFQAMVDLLYVWDLKDHVEGRAVLFANTSHGPAMERARTHVDGAVHVRGRVEFGDLCSTIVRVAYDGAFDLIVLGIHGRTRIAHMLHGHVASNIARQATCPVISVRLTPEPELDEAG
jgi:nucleotide-binding universal stress UspA family protein